MLGSENISEKDQCSSSSPYFQYWKVVDSLLSLTTPAMHNALSGSAHLAEDTTTAPSDGAHLAETPQQ